MDREQTITLEQQRVLRIVEQVLQVCPKTTSKCHIAEEDNTPVEKFRKMFRDNDFYKIPTPIRKHVQSGSSSSQLILLPTSIPDRRVLVDGVAGAGKTFLLGILLQQFDRVRYLVKKRNFVDDTRKRFNYHERLDAQTIDAFLMRHFGIRSLPAWLQQRRENLTDLKRHACAHPVPCNDNELIFVDEYSLIEQSLAELLAIALTQRRVVLVGDCNQQPAIGDSADQPVRTLLGYRNICFMYDNVRTKDARLLRRLSHFNARTKDMRFRAIHNLPSRKCIDMRDYFENMSVRKRRNHPSLPSSFLPRIIVNSNGKVNYLNWAIGYLITRHYNKQRSKSVNCLRYQRKIILTQDAFNELVSLEECSSEWHMRRSNGAHHMEFPDDAFADEQFVIVGLRYRMIACQNSWPAQIGTRVIVTRILSENSVELTTENDRAISFIVHKMRIRSYEYRSKWNAFTADSGSRFVNARTSGGDRVRMYMFPFVMDAATTVYQVQGLTLEAKTYARCYIDVQGMDI